MSIEDVIYVSTEHHEWYGGDPGKERSWSVTLLRRYTFTLTFNRSTR